MFVFPDGERVGDSACKGGCADGCVAAGDDLAPEPDVHCLAADPAHRLTFSCVILQGSAKRRSPGWVNCVPALAYHFCLALLAAYATWVPPFSRAL